MESWGRIHREPIENCTYAILAFAGTRFLGVSTEELEVRDSPNRHAEQGNHVQLPKCRVQS